MSKRQAPWRRRVAKSGERRRSRMSFAGWRVAKISNSHGDAISRRDSPEVYGWFAPSKKKRARGTPDARGVRSLVWGVGEYPHERNHHGCRRHSGVPRAMASSRPALRHSRQPALLPSKGFGRFDVSRVWTPPRFAATLARGRRAGMPQLEPAAFEWVVSAPRRPHTQRPPARNGAHSNAPPHPAPRTLTIASRPSS